MRIANRLIESGAGVTEHEDCKAYQIPLESLGICHVWNDIDCLGYTDNALRLREYVEQYPELHL